MVLPDADGVHSAGGGPPPALHTHTRTHTHTLSLHCDSASTWALTATDNFTVICTSLAPPFLSLSLTQKHFLWQSLFPYSPLLKTSHASLKMELWFPLPPKMRERVPLTLMTAIHTLQIWSECSSYQHWHRVSHNAVNASSAVWDECRRKLQTAVWLSQTRAVRQGLRSEAAVWLRGQRERASELEYVLLVWFVCELEGNV